MTALAVALLVLAVAIAVLCYVLRKDWDCDVQDADGE